MTVKELIEKLQQLPQDLRVEGEEWPIEYVDEFEDVFYNSKTEEEKKERVVYLH